MCINVNCRTTIAVSDDKWNWICTQGHPNTLSAALCAHCAEKRPATQPNPIVECPNCGTGVQVSSTVGLQRVRSAGTEIQAISKTAYSDGVKEYERLKSTPNEFNCSTCNTRLMCPPAQPWLCQNCNTNNSADSDKCSSCNQQITKEVLCGHCSQVTSIPSTNLMNSVRFYSLETQRTIKGTYASLTNSSTTTTTTTRPSAPPAAVASSSSSSSSEATPASDELTTPPQYDELPPAMQEPVSNTEGEGEGEGAGEADSKKEGGNGGEASAKSI